MQFSASVSRPSLACKSLCVTNVDSSKSTFILQNSIQKASALPPKFWHIFIFPPRQAKAKNAKEPKFSSRTALATTMTGQCTYIDSSIMQTITPISKTTIALKTTKTQWLNFVFWPEHNRPMPLWRIEPKSPYNIWRPILRRPQPKKRKK